MQADTPGILIVEDQTILRELLSALITNDPGLRLLGAYGDGLEGLKACERLKPDIVILDVQLPGLNGIDFIDHAKPLSPQTRFLAITAHFSEKLLAQLLGAGVHGVLSKTSPVNQLTDAIRRVRRGESYFSPEVAPYVDDARARAKSAEPILPVLTAREREVLKLVAEGRTSKEIASAFSLSVKTVETHRMHIMRKLRARSAVDLTRMAIREGLIEPPH